ncbi:motility associated factor glycosyltransferase family protein [Clostridium tyrobutyricum]|uniref:motility associated factor glycosyltransferase family protein n=1 Tax=Clostridium tyrobutyricum TaxID=1519 RepID=UPI0018A11CEA|nr:6-hydroxymethylpterin diphosphokinase MptE-like protein [Clostridium tyrobutyricum]
MQSRTIKLEYSKDGKPILKADKIYLHSKFYPEREAKKFVDNNKSIFQNKDSVVVYGLALGYHILELLKQISSYSKLYIFDVDTEIYDIGKKLECYNNIFKDRRVKLYIGINALKNISKIKYIDDIIIYNPSLKILPDKYEHVKNIFKNFTMARCGIEKSKHIMEENYIHNLKEDASSMKDFFNNYILKNSPVVMAAAGTSLDYNIDTLKTLYGKIKIFCVGSSLRTLMKNGIIPDMICIIDCNEIVYNQLKGYENLNVPLCFLSTASRWAVSNYNGPKYMFYNDSKKTDDIIINTAKTVAVPTMDIAVKCGASQIILLGQDLAFLNNRTHTDSYSELYGIEDKVENKSKLYKKVEGINGKLLNTRSEYLNFKYSIEQEIENNPQVKFINCSGGAKIIGTEYMKLSQWVEIFKNL